MEQLKHTLLALIAEAKADFESAQRIEEENDYSDAMESMERTRAEGYVDGLARAFRQVFPEVEIDTDDVVPRWTEDSVAVCDFCENGMIASIESGDEDGYGWNCINRKCKDFAGEQVYAEDLVAVGVPEWLSELLAGSLQFESDSTIDVARFITNN